MVKLSLLTFIIALALLLTVLVGCRSDTYDDSTPDISLLGEEPNNYDSVLVLEPAIDTFDGALEDPEQEVEPITRFNRGVRSPPPPFRPEPLEHIPGYARFIDGRLFSTELTRFDLSHLEFSVERMAHNVEQLQYMTNLTELRMWHAEVSDISHLSGLTNLNVLSLGDNKISDLTPLAGLTNLTHLYLFGNEISDITPLAGLKNLRHLSLFGNKIDDLTPLSDLVNLTVLELSDNQISDITPLAGLANLEELSICNNQIIDITPLDNLKNLRYLNWDENPIFDMDSTAANINVYDSISAQIGDIIEFGGLNWIVLDMSDNYVMIITENIFRAGLGHFYNRHAGVTWESSFPRLHLNNEFLRRFSLSERSRIKETLVINNNNPWFGTNGGNDTMDYVFLLSIEEVVQYFGDSGQLQNHELSDWWGGIYDEYNSLRVAKEIDGGYAWQWLRSRGGSHLLASGVDGTGALAISGAGVSNTAGRVRPVMWIYLGES